MSAAGDLRWTTDTVPGAGVEINIHRTGGDGPAWVLLHGFSDNGRCWDRVVASLPPELAVISLDARNHGASGTGPGGHAHHVADVISVLRHLGLSSPTLMGHSVGARTAAGVAALAPDLVGRLVLVDPPWRNAPIKPPSTKRLDATREYIASTARLTVQELLAHARSQHGDWHPDDHAPWAVAKQQLRVEAAEDLAVTDWRADAAALTCPTLLVYAEPGRDGIVTPEIAVAVAENSAIVNTSVAAAGHNLQRENHAGFIASLRDFLT